MFVLGKALWFLLTPSNALTLLAFGGALAALWRRRARTPQIVAASAIAGLIVCGFSPIGYWLAIPLEGRFPQPRPLPAHVAGIIALGGGIRSYESAEHDTLSVNESGDRLIALADLARRYPAAKVVMSGGSADIFVKAEPEADLLRQHAETLGLDPKRIIVEDRSRTTYENALYTRELVKPGDGETWLLITSAWHMPRAVGAFRQAGFPVTAYPVDFRSLGPRETWRMFDAVASGLHLTDLMLKEWIGLVAYRALGRTDALLPGPDAH